MHASTQRLYEAIAHLKNERGQANVARLLGETAQQIWAWEKRGVSRRGALKAQTAFGINAAWIHAGTGDMLIAGAPPAIPHEPASTERVRDALRTAGVVSTAQLQAATRLSPEDLRASVADLMKRGEALASTPTAGSWISARSIPDITTTGTVPVFQVDTRGRLREFGTLVPTTQGRYWMEERAGANQLHDGLPWFVQDMRPQGFLGRAFALAHPELHLSTHPQQWTDDQVLRSLALAGEDLPGNLIVGARSFDRFMNRPASQLVGPEDYPRLASAAMQGSAPGSSAGGEQPKFTCVRRDGTHVLVKFSPPEDTPFGRRWADLLVCEHLALEQLEAAGIPAARSRIHRGGGRTFFEAERFDRTARGRIGMVSLLAYDSEYVGQMDNWGATAERMQRQGLLTSADADHLRFLEVFGLAIANTDRHYGNVSLLIDAGGDWALAPAYDQLPMLYAPVAGEIVEREAIPECRPTAETLSVWLPASTAALRFWESAANHAAISKEFRRRVAHVHVLALKKMLDADER